MEQEIRLESQIKAEEKELAIINFKNSYYVIKDILKQYCDLPEDYYPILSLWILGTYVHKEFNTFPELFINAVKGSGKSRLLKLIAELSYRGKVVIDLKEAVLFRTAKSHTICIDEFEKVGHKDNGTMRTLINAAYKKGAYVERMKKVNFKGQEEQIVEKFDLYTPVCMANIWGIEDVLADRCIMLILEKSSDKSIVRLMENFGSNFKMKGLKEVLVQLVYILCGVVTSKNITNKWNNYILQHYTTLTTPTTLNTQTTQTTPSFPMEHDNCALSQEELDIFKKIDKTGLDGRNLELFFPLFMIANIVGQEVFDDILRISQIIVKDKKAEEYAESKDVSLIDFLSHQISWRGSFKSVHDITQEFRMITIEDPEEEKWVNPRWIGRALKRNKLILEKRRLRKGIEVLIDIDKAGQLLKRFKEHEEVKHE